MNEDGLLMKGQPFWITVGYHKMTLKKIKALEQEVIVLAKESANDNPLEDTTDCLKASS